MKPKQRILIIDDLDISLLNISSLLKFEGFDVITASSGRSGLLKAEETNPDLILLDVSMPDISGYDVCRWLKANDKTMDIPVILYSFQDYDDNVEKGLQLGAIDYVKRPFSFTEIIARVKNHVALKSSIEEFKKVSKSLQKQLESKNDFLGIVLHEIINPLDTIKGFASLIANELTDSESREKPDFNEILDDVLIIKERCDYLNRIIRKLIEMEKIDYSSNYMSNSETEVSCVIFEVLKHFSVAANEKNIKIYWKCNKNLRARIDADYFREIIENLVSNALKFSPFHTSIKIEAIGVIKKAIPYMRISIQDEGPGFSDEDRLLLFSRFQKLSARPTNNEASAGLGLSIVKKLVELHSGKISLESEHGKGAKFIIEFKMDIDDSIAGALYCENEFELFSQP